MRQLFWFSAVVVIYVYFGYPLLLKLHVLGGPKTWRRGHAQPLISVIVAAHNEESVIEAKIKNLLSSDYPRERIEVLIGSDGSSDSTEDIVRRFAADGVGLISFPQHQGKSAIQNGLVAKASGSILVFTDADCILHAHTLSCLVENFGDEQVGLVSGIPRYQNDRETNITQNEDIYLRYETWLRIQESKCGLLAMASGSLFAIRRNLWKPLDPDVGDDFALPLRVALSRKRNVLDARAAAFTALTQNRAESMFRLKMRVVSKDLRALLASGRILNPFHYGALAVSLWSHKLLRWFVPCFLLVLFTSNVLLCHIPFYRAVLVSQIMFYGTALVGFALRNNRLVFPLSIPMSFCVVNLASLIGTAQCLIGRKSGRWKPVRKQSPLSELKPKKWS
jgi:cellulose synthase/poly-beta-1,6-N-acetylglucosamine synthase-like glycosyltransferase